MKERVPLLCSDASWGYLDLVEDSLVFSDARVQKRI